MPVTQTGQLGVSFQGVQATRIFLNPIFHDENVRNIFMMMPNVVYRKKMIFATALDDYLRQRTGCGFKPLGNFDLNERCVETTMLKGEVEQCFDEFVDTVLMELTRKSVEMGDLSGTTLATILLNRMQQGASRQINKLAFFGDKSTADATQNIVDGLWTVYLPQLVTQNLTPHVDSNSGTALASGEAIDLLDAVFENATNELKAFEMSRRRFYVSNNVFEQLTKDLRDGATGSGAFIQETEDGRVSIRFRGIQVVPFLRWEALAAQYGAGDLVGVTSNFNLVLYTMPENLIIATDRASDMNRIQTWFDMDTETYKARTAFKLGFNYIHPSLMSVAW
jgi:hypothetical protein